MDIVQREFWGGPKGSKAAVKKHKMNSLNTSVTLKYLGSISVLR